MESIRDSDLKNYLKNRIRIVIKLWWINRIK